MVTPFDADDRLNLGAAEQLVERFVREGAGGLYICGSSGEAPLLRRDERKALAECVIGAVGGRIPVVVHVGHTAPAVAVELAEHAARCDADGISATFPPFYAYRPSQIAEYWSTLSRAGGLPFYGYVLSDLGGTKQAMSAWVAGLQRVPTMAGVKFTNADTFQLAMLKHLSGGRLNIFSGLDQCFLGCRAQGADGAIGTSYNVALPLWLRVNERFEAGDHAGAEALMSHCARVVAGFIPCFMPMLKRILQRQGIDCGRVRPPLREVDPLDEGAVDELMALIESAPQPGAPVN